MKGCCDDCGQRLSFDLVLGFHMTEDRFFSSNAISHRQHQTVETKHKAISRRSRGSSLSNWHRRRGSR